MRESSFISYPKTPHVQGSSVVDDDESVSSGGVSVLLKKFPTTVITEKVDGTNVSVHFELDWVPICQKRSGLITQGEHEQYVRFRDFVNENLENLNRVLTTRYALFGEWLLCRHGVEYDQLSSFFQAFDVYDKEQDRFLSHSKMTQLLDNVVQCVPVLATTWNGSIKELENLVTRSKFSSSATAEGVYIRFESQVSPQILHCWSIRFPYPHCVQ